MSTYEYNDLFMKCQKTGKYHVFTFDIENYKKINDIASAQYKLIELNIMMYRMIQEEETKQNKKILVFENGFSEFGEYRLSEFGYKQEPFIYGDLIGFTVYRDTITKEEVLSILKKAKSLLNINFEFHLADGYYETNDYSEGDKKYFRGYCIDLLSNLHKSYNKKVRKQLEKQKIK